MAEADGDGRLAFDCFSALLLLCTALLGAYLPRCLSARGGHQSGTATSLAFHLGNMLSGGVMLSAGFCHLLADSLRQLAFIGRFPIATFLAAVGYLITLLADQLVQVLTAEPSPTAAAGDNPARGGAADLAGQQHRYVRLDKQQGSGEIIEMIEATDGWSAAAGSAGGALQEQGSDIRVSAWGSGGGLLEPVGLSPSKKPNAARHNSNRLPATAAAAAAATTGGTAAAGVAPSLSTGLPRGGSAADGAAQDGDMAVCLMATGSPRAMTSSSVFSRSGATSRGGAAAPPPASVSKSSSSRAGLEHALQSGTVTDAVGSSSPAANGTAWRLAGDDLSVSHPATPDPMQQQQQADLLAFEPAVLQLNQQQQEQQRQLLLMQHEAASAADAVGGTAGSTPGQHCQPSLELAAVATAAATPRGKMAALNSQQQQQQQQHVQVAPGSLHHQQQQQQQRQHHCCNGGRQHVQHEQHGWQPTAESCRWAGGACPEGPSQPPSGGHCSCSQPCCCCGSSGKAVSCCARLLAPTRSDVMTEASTVARAAEHLELEIMHSAGAAGSHNHAHFQVFLSHQPLSFATTVLLACALCIHSVLEGIALGAQQTMEATQDIMLAIAAHKGLAAYALGASIVESKASATKFWTVIAMFASATPIGIAIGYASSNLGHGSAGAAMSALASGTFLYVALNEVIPKELEHPDGHRVLKVVALLLGFGLMSLLAVWA